MKVFFFISIINYRSKKSHPETEWEIILKNRNVSKSYFTSINSTSKIKVACGGITPPAPAAP